MLHIAICDDEERDLKKLEKLILEYADNNDIMCKVFAFSDGVDLLTEKKKFDLVFLDIEMPGMNGIETAQKIREQDMSVPIVYITSYSKYWRSAYKVHAFDFISKPYDVKDIQEVFRDFFNMVKESESRVIPINTDKGVVYQNVEEICYLLIEQRKTILVGTLYSEYTATEFLSDLKEKIDSDQFFLTHRSCLVNLKYVNNLSKNDGVIMKDGTWLPLAQRKQMYFMYAMSRFMRKNQS